MISLICRIQKQTQTQTIEEIKALELKKKKSVVTRGSLSGLQIAQLCPFLPPLHRSRVIFLDIILYLLASMASRGNENKTHTPYYG